MQKWNLNEIFESNDAFTKALDSLKDEINNYSKFQSKLNNAENVNAYFKFDEKMDRELSKLYSYASMKFDLDQNNLESQSNMSRLQNFFVIYAQAIAFVDDELLKNNFEDYKTWAKDYEYIKFNLYRLDQLFHSKEHVLKPELEQLLSLYSPITSSFRSTYGLLENADTKPVTVTTSDNKTHTFTKSNYTTLLGEYSNSQEDRKKIFEAFFKHYDDYKNTC